MPVTDASDSDKICHMYYYLIVDSTGAGCQCGKFPYSSGICDVGTACIQRMMLT